MSYPTVDLDKKRVILLSGFEKTRSANEPLSIKAKKKPRRGTGMRSRSVMFRANGCRLRKS